MGDGRKPGRVSPALKDNAAPTLRSGTDRGSGSKVFFTRRVVFRAELTTALLCFSSAVSSAHAAVNQGTSIFSRDASPASGVFSLSLFVFAIMAGIFLVVASLGAYAVIKFRSRPGDEDEEPVQIFGSNQIEVSWTIIPVLIVVVLFLTTARMIFAVQDAKEPSTSIKVNAIGHQFWWEFEYPQYGFVTANELHIPANDPKSPSPTFMKLSSADVVHSIWVPRLAGKTDLIPGRVNEMWLDPAKPGLYLGQCGQFCGTEHAKMLLRVYVEPRAQFDAWVKNQQQSGRSQTEVAAGKHVFESQACVSCHAIKGTIANGRFGPDLTHLMSRGTIAAGAAQNTPENLRRWIQNPDVFKAGSNMPVMNLTDEQLDQVTAYLATLR